MGNKTIEGQRYIVEENGDNKVIHIGLEGLPFIDKITLTDGTILQNMKLELNAEQPPLNELTKALQYHQ